MDKSRTMRVSKYLSLVLRHEPAAAGVTLDAEGWVAVSDLLAGAAAHGMTVTRDELEEVVRTSDKQRFALSDDGLRIRANQGHSLTVDLGLQPLTPPEILFHGTVERFWPSIRETGLVRRARQHVHLSSDVETAARVGERRGTPVILTVAAGAMQAAGFSFFRSENGVWLTESVPPRFIRKTD
jgi:putative RNA 2'-phosphotransferase